MALTYDESAALMKDPEFQGRTKVSALKYADSIMLEASSVAAHNTRVRWAQGCMQQPDVTAQQLQPNVVMDAAVQSAGSDVTDAALQGAVESVVNKML